MTVERDLAEGARNLLINCASLKRGETLLIVRESPDFGWYDKAAPEAVAAAARALGVEFSSLAVGPPANDPDPRLEQAIAAHDCTIFFARVGDQDRFGEAVPGKRSVMSYARDVGMLASAYGRTSHLAFRDLARAVNGALLNAGRIEISCPLGTAVLGAVSEQAREEPVETSVLRFPLGVPQPVDASGFSGRVALARYLTPTGSRAYEPAYLKLEETVFAEIEAGRIVGFSGNRAEVTRVSEHYKRVAGRFGIDPDVVHSWHAGLHPGCAYAADAAQDPDRWSNTVFTNPRILHFHTCGSYAPGEICWNLIDHTVSIDGTRLWENGRLHPEAFAQTRNCVEEWPELADLFTNPSESIGLPPSG